MKRILFCLLTLVQFSVLAQTSQVTTLAGTTQGYLDGNISVAQFFTPREMVYDSQGNLFVADGSNHCIRKITPSGVVSTFAGTNVSGFVNGNPTDARFNYPIGLAIDSSDNLYVVDTNNHSIRKITSAGVVSTIAGTGTYGYTNGVGSIAKFNSPQGIVVDSSGVIYVTDSGNDVIRKITIDGQVTTFTGTTSGNVDGASNVARFYSPTGIVIGIDGNFYVTDTLSHSIRKITPSGVVSTIAGYFSGFADGTGNVARFNQPRGIEVDMNGNFYVADEVNYRVRKVTPAGEVTTYAGNGTIGNVNGPANTATFRFIWGISIDNQGNILVSDPTGNSNNIRKISPNLTGGNSCANATALMANSGTVNIGTISGTIPSNGICYTYSQSNPNANWWSFTPTQNGLLDITTVTPQNVSTVDTRLSVFTGNCSALTCFTGSDNISGTDLRSNLKDVILTAGTTYYFVFDDKVSDNAAVNFYYEFTPQTCFRPNSIDAVAGSNTEVTYTVDWDSPTLGDTTPDSFTIQVGPEGYTVDTAAATQTYTNLTGNSATLTGLTPNTVYDFYIKSVCSPTDTSVWYGPFKIMTEFTAVSPTYAENFDSAASFLFVGWSRSGGTSSSLWRTYTSGPNAFTQSGQYSIYSPIEPTVNTPANAFAYTRKMNLLAGQNYKVSYYPRVYTGVGVTLSGNMDVVLTPNTDYTNTTTHTALASRNLTGQTTFSTMYEDAFTVPSNGVYRLGFKNGMSRTAGTATSYLMLDTVVISTMLSVDDFNTSGLSMFPNPVLDHVSIANDENIQINTYAVVDINGRTLIGKKYDASNNLIDLSGLTRGIYFIQLETEKGTLSKKIIKE